MGSYNTCHQRLCINGRARLDPERLRSPWETPRVLFLLWRLIHQYFKRHCPQLIVNVTLHVFGVRAALDVNQDAVEGVLKAHHDQGRPEAFLVEVRVEETGETLRRVVGDVPDILNVGWILKFQKYQKTERTHNKK